MTTNGFALIDRKTKEILWVSLKRPFIRKSAVKNDRYYFDGFNVGYLKETQLIPITIRPKKTKKKKGNELK